MRGLYVLTTASTTGRGREEEDVMMFRSGSHLPVAGAPLASHSSNNSTISSSISPIFPPLLSSVLPSSLLSPKRTNNVTEVLSTRSRNNSHSSSASSCASSGTGLDIDAIGGVVGGDSSEDNYSMDATHFEDAGEGKTGGGHQSRRKGGSSSGTSTVGRLNFPTKVKIEDVLDWMSYCEDFMIKSHFDHRGLCEGKQLFIVA